MRDDGAERASGRPRRLAALALAVGVGSAALAVGAAAGTGPLPGSAFGPAPGGASAAAGPVDADPDTPDPGSPEAARADDPERYPIGVDFDNDVLPVLTRAGCNSGECHGAALGQADFRLSLGGWDPDADWRALARELRGRRIDVVDPDASLVLRKASRAVYHGGGRPLPADGPGYAILRDWIAAGAPRSTDARRPVALELEGEDRLRVTARYDDGSWRDVTDWTRFSSNDTSIAEVDEEGRIDLWRAGETAVVARYGGLLAVRRVTEPFGEASVSLPRVNFVDEHTAARLERLGLDAPPDVADATFLRRATLDLTGRLPTPDEVLAFERAPDREALVERLIDSEAFARHWGYRLAELFPERPGLAAWLTRQVADERPWSRVVAEALTATGWHPGSALFESNDPKLMAETVAEGFLGQSIRCAQCHNHPFSSFTREDYFGLASFFARTRMGEDGVALATRGELRIPDTDDAVEPAFPGGDRAVFGADQDRRVALAAWLIEEPDFARGLANRVWAALLGEGLVEPLDDLRPSNPGTDPELLDALAEHFAESDHSLRALVGAIARSATYARLKRPHPLPAEVLYDALADATGVPNPERAVTRPTLESELLDVSGRGERFEGSLAQALHLLDAPELEHKLARMRRLPPDDLFVRVLARRPTEQERALARSLGDRAAYEDLVWALLNTTEFLYVH